MNTLLKKLFNTGITPALSLSDRRSIRFINFSLVYGFAFCVISMVINLIFMGWQGAIMPFLYCLLFSIGFYYQQQHKFQTTKLFIMGIAVIGVIASCWIFGLKGYPYYLFLLSFGIGMVFYPTKKQQLNLLYIHFLALTITLSIAPYIPAPIEIPFPFAFGIMTFLFVLVLFYFIIETYTTENQIFESNTNNLVTSLQEQKKQIEQQSIDLKLSNERLQEEIQAKNLVEEQLKQSNERLKSFVYVASHDLKEPLRTIGSFSYLLKRELKNEEQSDANEYLNFISSGVKRMSTLLEDLLAYSRVENAEGIEFQNIDTNQLLLTVKNNLTSLIERNRGTINIQSNLPIIQGCPTQLNQLFQNLISNALKFKGDKDPIIDITYQEKETAYIFAIKDNGIGISAKQQSKIFGAFQRLHKNDYEGSGIGLAICEKVVKNHHGKIWLTSTPNEGTTFYFSIERMEKTTVVPTSAVATLN